MNRICPVCNGFTLISQLCPHCGTALDDLGSVENLKGPYSPYEDVSSFADNHAPLTACTHVAICNSCGLHSYIVVKNDVR